MNTQEISIPVPWGHISAITWGNPMATKVLCIHGKQDNCGTFDRLIPLLRKGFYFICVDLPGHGKSSHFGAGFRLTLEHFTAAMKRVVDHLKWTKFKCIGHSLGGMVASLFAAIYPEHFDQLIMLDCAGPISIRPEDTVKSMRKFCDELLNLEKKTANRGPPSYTYQQAVNLLLTKRPSKLTPESANVLVKRSLQTNSNGHYSFTTDQRMKITYNTMQSPMQQWMVVQSIKCPLLYIWVTDNPEQKLDNVKLTRKLFKSIPNAQVVRVIGNHDVHLNHPERIADLINVFFVSEKSKL